MRLPLSAANSNNMVCFIAIPTKCSALSLTPLHLNLVAAYHLIPIYPLASKFISFFFYYFQRTEPVPRTWAMSSARYCCANSSRPTSTRRNYAASPRIRRTSQCFWPRCRSICRSTRRTWVSAPTAQAPGLTGSQWSGDLAACTSIAVHFGIWPRPVEQAKLCSIQKRAKLRTKYGQAIWAAEVL